ncbi:four helix bundle protein [Elizabethkingia meningoseptica]|uniref:four helix bundle protein n=1 Tax=Elizabethkingia meningoseptica TaxID=238 RepID=UPI0008A91698|nr:four helix bundle protein [Elizabethkingia meningoseptica]MDE5450074.1 four helix bundle protein [Elizabethkingia meningoseptica]MDE5470776.1 four helix bundle protein [Elizabethkingia meningoseptica]MDE5519580.1 four helix bundle protein [Elizabethkingia meningoseptica]MDE5522009.1 four helix bundle protein [Elizabethkingia meningoseptica]OHT29768.1 four helix bundle protein [Elizabethkingia meningoseptica]
MNAHRLHDLQIWQKSILLVKEVYLLTGDLPTDEKYGLAAQIKRCAVSIPSNIAEGAGRNNSKEFYQFLGIAQGSSYELETQLILLVELNFIEEIRISSLLQKLTEIQKMIYKFKTNLIES